MNCPAKQEVRVWAGGEDHTHVLTVIDGWTVVGSDEAKKTYCRRCSGGEAGTAWETK